MTKIDPERMKRMKWYWYFADIHSEDQISECAQMCDMDHTHMKVDDLPPEAIDFFYMSFDDPWASFEEEGPGMYHRLFGTAQQLKDVALKYRAYAIDALWHIDDDDPLGEPFHDGGDMFDDDYGTIELLIQFAYLLEDATYLEPMLKSFNETTGHNHEFKHPYHLREDTPDYVDFNLPRHCLQTALNNMLLK